MPNRSFVSAICAAMALSSVLTTSCLPQTPQNQAVSVDLLITNSTIVTMDPNRRVIEAGQIAIGGDSIVALGPAPLLPKGTTAKQTIDAKGALVLPGFINGHT